MLESVKISKRQSEIRQQLATLAGKENPEENELRSMETLDGEYSSNEIRYRASLISEDEERSQAGAELETRSDREYSELVNNFELRQVAMALDEGYQLSGQTLEVVQEMRQQGGYQGIPVPLAALEVRAGESLAANQPDPISTKPIVDRLFPASVMNRLGGNVINIGHGQTETPICTQGATASWADGELADVGAAVEYQTIDRPLKPNNNLGCQMIVSRRSLKQAGAQLEAAIRRDMAAAVGVALDKAVILGSGANGEPLGLIPGQATYGFTLAAVNGTADYSTLRSEATKFLIRSAAMDYKAIRLLLRTELLDGMDDVVYEVGSAVTELDRLAAKLGAVIPTASALDAPAGGPPEQSSAVMACTSNGVSPFTLGIWGGLDLVKDVYTKASSGQLVLTGIVTADVTASRAEQVTILTGLE